LSQQGCGGLQGTSAKAAPGRRTQQPWEVHEMRWPWSPRERPEVSHTDPIPDYDRVFPPDQQRGRPIWSPLLGRWIDAPDPKALTEPTEQYPIVTPAQRQRGRGAEAGR
jgi:hypothetical protein